MQNSDGSKTFEREIISVPASSNAEMRQCLESGRKYATESFVDFKWPESPATTKRLNLPAGIVEGISNLDHRHSVWTRMRQQASALQDPP